MTEALDLVQQLRDESCGYGIGHALLMQEAAQALETALSRLREVETALEPFARLADCFSDLPDQELSLVRSGPRAGNAKLSDFRRARAALSNSPLGEGVGSSVAESAAVLKGSAP